MKIAKHLFAFVVSSAAVSLLLANDKPTAPSLDDFAPTKDYRTMKGGWLLSFDGTRRVPRYTLERLTRHSFGEAKREDTKFHPDPEIPAEFAPSPDDYHGFTELYDRGHMAAAANHSHSDETMAETFTIANAVPEGKRHNEIIWRHLEDHVRSLVGGNAVVWVLTCPVWTPDDYPKSLDSRDAKFSAKSIGSHHQQVPPYLGKSILIESPRGVEMKSWLVPNDDDAIENHVFDDFIVAADELESATGLNLWKSLNEPLQTKLEGTK